MAKKIDEQSVLGEKYGRLTLTRFIERRGNNLYFECDCECGNKKIASYSNIKCGNVRSCGCWQRESRIITHTTHRKENLKLYKVYDGMKQRCCNPNNISYKNYGGRGITVCDEWLGKHGFDTFFEWANKNGYKEGLSIDRIDNNKGYSPSNCKWATLYEQGANKRNNIVITYHGETHIISEWARIYGIKSGTIRKRYHAGYRGEQLFSKTSMCGGNVL